MAFVLYRSSAGSGKTYTLVKEYLKLVLQNPDKFRHILAITFTNKAAGEMKDRIMQSLKNLAKGEDKNLEDTLKQEIPHLKNIDKISSDILTTLLHNYSDFAIMTIDSFIHKVIKAFALEIGLPLNFSIDLNYEKIETYVIEKLMAEVGKDTYITEIIMTLVFARVQEEKSWNIEGDIRKFEKELFNEKNFDWVSAVSAFDNVLFDRVTNQLKTIRDDYIKKFNQLGAEALDIIRTAGLTIDDFAYKKSGAAGVFQKCAHLGERSIKKFDIGSRFRNRQWTGKSAPPEIQAAVENILDNGLSEISEKILLHFDNNRSRALTAASVLDNIYLAAIINRLKSLVDEYKMKNNVVPISEFNEKVYQIVKHSPVPFIYSILGEKFNHYLIDEFQDTSRLQWENLFPLIDNSLGSDFLSMAVGDGKQSIYRWRGGDVEIMEKDVENKILPQQLKVFPLGRNFRSRKNIVDFNNRFFSEVSRFYKENQELLGHIYSDIAQDPVRKEGGFVSLQFIEENSDASGEDYDTDAAVFENVDHIINHCLERDYVYNDIAILVRENKKGQKVARYLLEKNIPVVSPDSLILSRIPLIRFLIDILVYLADPADRIAEASIVYFLGLNINENPLDPATMGDSFMKGQQWELSPEIREFFRRREYLIRMPVYEVIEEVLRIFQLSTSLDFAAMGYLQAFLDVVSNYTAENSVDLSSFLDWWEFSKDEFAVTVPETKPAVKIMSIHKAKGLEFPVVIIPYAGWEHKMDKQLWLHAEPALPTDLPPDLPMPVNSVKLLEDTFFKKAYNVEAEKVLIDNINLLYVAFTRAVDNLYIIAQRKKKNENYQRLNELAVPMMVEDRERDGNFTFGELVVQDEAKSKPTDVFFDSAHKLISNRWDSRITIRRKSKEFWRFDTGYRAKRRNWGILVHQVLSHIRTLDDVPHAVDNALLAGDIERKEKRTLERKLTDIFEIETVKEWFDPAHGHHVFAESPIITEAGVLRPDRVMVLEDRVVIIDFKTGRKNKAHAQQLIQYKEVIRGMGYKNIDAYLLYLDNKKIEKI
ncbi:MAG: UvrD-helicase domain-containing protein [bacterium]|nr:UvrD-helicase domain-containing protein [bacterium]